MNALWGLVFTALAAFIGLVILLSFETTREWVGLGNVDPTGLPGVIAGFFGGGGGEETGEPSA